jgi:hypothetical protein
MLSCQTVLEQTYELTVNVATDGDGAADGLNIGFLHQHFTGLSISVYRPPDLPCRTAF